MELTAGDFDGNASIDNKAPQGDMRRLKIHMPPDLSIETSSGLCCFAVTW